MKKIKNIIIVFLVLFMFSGCGKNNLVKLSYKEFKNKLNSKDSFFVEIVQDGCSHCAEFTPKLKEVLNDYDVKGYQLNLTYLDEDDYEDFSNSYSVSGTPTIIFITNGQETSLLQRINGNVSVDKLVSKLKSNGYIKE